MYLFSLFGFAASISFFSISSDNNWRELSEKKKEKEQREKD
jgi:hypothetical protein